MGSLNIEGTTVTTTGGAISSIRRASQEFLAAPAVFGLSTTDELGVRTYAEDPASPVAETATVEELFISTTLLNSQGASPTNPYRVDKVVEVLRGRVRLDASVLPGASAKGGVSTVFFSLVPDAALTDLMVYDPTLTPSPVAVGPLSAAVTQDGAIVFASPDRQLALGIYTRGEVSQTSSRKITAGPQGFRMDSSPGIGMDVSRARIEVFLLVGTYDEVAQEAQDIYAGTYSPGATPASVAGVNVPTQVIVGSTWGFVAQVIDSGGSVVASYNEPVNLVGDVAQTVLASNGIAVFSGLPAVTTGLLSFAITSGDLLPAQASVSVVNGAATLLALVPASFAVDAQPPVVAVVGQNVLPGATATVDMQPVPFAGANITLSPLAEGLHDVRVQNPDAQTSNALVLKVDPAGTVPGVPVADTYAFLVVPADVPGQTSVHVLAFDSSYAPGDVAGVDTTVNAPVTLSASVEPAGTLAAAGFGTTNLVNGAAMFPLFLFADGTYVVDAVGGLTSSSTTFVVNNTTFPIANITPSSIAAGSPDTQVTLTSSFWPEGDVTVRVNGLALPTTWASLTSVQAMIPASLLTLATTLAVDALVSGSSSTPVVGLPVTPPSAPADHLVFTSSPATASAPVTFVVELRDALNTLVPDVLAVTLMQTSGPGSLQGALTTTSVLGVATFPAITVSGVGVHLISAVGGSLAPATTSVQVDPKTAIVTAVQPSSFSVSAIPAQLSVLGQNFESGATVDFNNGVPHVQPATNILGGSLDVSPPILVEGLYQVSVTNPGAPASNSVPMNVGPQTVIGDSYVLVMQDGPAGQVTIAVQVVDSGLSVVDDQYTGVATLSVGTTVPAPLNFVSGLASHTLVLPAGVYAVSVSGEFPTQSGTLTLTDTAPVLNSTTPSTMEAGIAQTIQLNTDVPVSGTVTIGGLDVGVDTNTVQVPFLVTASAGFVAVTVTNSAGTSTVNLEVTPSTATQVSGLPASIVVDPTGWQRVSGSHVASATPLASAINAANGIYSVNGLGVTEVIVVDGQLPGGSILTSGLSTHPIVVRPGHGTPVLTSELYLQDPHVSFVEFWGSTFLCDGWGVRTPGKSINSSGAFFGDATNKHEGLVFDSCLFLGQWDLDWIRLSANESVRAPVLIASTMYDELGQPIGPLAYPPAQVQAAVDAGTWIDGTPSPIGHSLFPGDPGDPAHPNYSTYYPPFASTGAQGGGILATNAWGWRISSCVFYNLKGLGIRLNGLGAQVISDSNTIEYSTFNKCVDGAILIDGSVRTNPMVAGSLGSALEHPNDTGGPGFANLKFDTCTFTDCGVSTYQTRVLGHAQGPQFHINCAYTKSLQHLPTGGGMQIRDPQQFQNSVLSVWYTDLRDAQGLELIPWTEYQQGFIGYTCTSGDSPLLGTQDFDLVCQWPYVPGTDLANQVYPAEIVGQLGVQDGSRIQQNQTVFLDGCTFTGQGSRPELSIGGAQSIIISGCNVQGLGLSIDPVFAGKHVSSLSLNIVANTPNILSSFSYGGSLYSEVLLGLALQGEAPAATPGTVLAQLTAYPPASGSFVLRGTVPLPDAWTAATLDAQGWLLEDSLGFQTVVQLEPVAWYPGGNVSVVEVISSVHNLGTAVYNLVFP